MAKQNRSLGRAELELLQYVDQHHPITVRDVAEYWSEQTGQTRTTVLKMMERLKAKGFLTRKKISGIYHYSPREPISNVVSQLINDFVRGVLGGSVSPFVAYLNQSGGEISDDELRQLKKLVSELECEKSRKARNEP